MSPEAKALVLASVFSAAMTAIMVLRGRQGKRRSKEALAATNEDCDARDVLNDWLATNPSIHPMAIPEGRDLIWRCLKAYERFRETHPFIKQDDFIEHLRHLCNGSPREDIFASP